MTQSIAIPRMILYNRREEFNKPFPYHRFNFLKKDPAKVHKPFQPGMSCKRPIAFMFDDFIIEKASSPCWLVVLLVKSILLNVLIVISLYVKANAVPAIYSHAHTILSL